MEKRLKRILKTKRKLKIPNALTRKTIKDARKGIGILEPITDIKAFLKSL